MDLTAFEGSLRASLEPLHYAAFFGSLLVFGLIERWPTPVPGANRRKRWPANIGITLLNVVLYAAIPVGAVGFADFVAAREWGLFHLLAVPALVALPFGLLVRSLQAYAVHAAEHKLTFLWRVHRVHHSDPVLDVTTTLRFHPLEYFITFPVLLATVAIFGISPLALMMYEFFEASIAVFSHGNYRLSDRFDRTLRKVLVTPAMHRIHHSVQREEADSNYGAVLTCWDRMFGTYRELSADENAALQLGLEGFSDQQSESLPQLLALPFISDRAIQSGGSAQIELSSTTRSTP